VHLPALGNGREAGGVHLPAPGNGKEAGGVHLPALGNGREASGVHLPAPGNGKKRHQPLLNPTFLAIPTSHRKSNISHLMMGVHLPTSENGGEPVGSKYLSQNNF